VNVSDLFPSRFLKGSELRGPVTVTIQRLAKEEVYKPGKGETDALIMYVVNGSRGVVLSKGLAFSIAEALNEPETDNWPGQKVTLYPQAMTVAGRELVTIRARAAAPQSVNGNGRT
jgi:hypothetical protein